MNIREYHPKDTLQITEIFSEVLGYEMSAQYFERRIQQMEVAGGYKIFVIEDDNIISGFIGLHTALAFEYENQIMRIIALAVREEYQGKGVGRKLLMEAEKYGTENGVAAMSVNSGLSREGSHIFYQKQGYNKKGYSFFKKL